MTDQQVELRVPGRDPLVFCPGLGTIVHVSRTGESGSGADMRSLHFCAALNNWFPLRPVQQHDEYGAQHFSIEVLPNNTFDKDLGGAGGHTGGGTEARSGLGLLVLPNIFGRRTAPWENGDTEEQYIAKIPACLSACRAKEGTWRGMEPHYSEEELLGVLFEFLLSDDACDDYELSDVDDLIEDPNSWLRWAHSLM